MGVFIAMFFFFMCLSYCYHFFKIVSLSFFLFVSHPLFIVRLFTSSNFVSFVSCILLFCCQPWIFSLFTLPFAYDLVNSRGRISH